MNNKWLITVSLLLLASSCSDELQDPVQAVPNDVFWQDDDTPQAIKVAIEMPSVSTNAQTRGMGSVGDVTAEGNCWHNDSLYFYAINTGAKSLANDTVNELYGIKTFLLGGHDNFGALAIAPNDTVQGDVQFVTTGSEVPYYSLNGAYNFFGYYAGDAKRTVSVSDDQQALCLDLEMDGTQDVMLAKASLSNNDKALMIESMIKNNQLEGNLEDYLAGGEVIAEKALIEKEFAKAFSSYSSRRGVRPAMKFKHQLSRLTFSVSASEPDAMANADCAPKLQISAYEERPYGRNEVFTYRDTCYIVKKEIILPTALELFFGDNDNARSNKASHLIEAPYFAEYSEYKTGDLVIFKGNAYRFTADYSKAGTPSWNDVTADYLEYVANRAYKAGDPLIYEGKAYICPVTIEAEDNTEWNDIGRKVYEYRRGVHVAKVELLDAVTNASIVITKDSISFVPGDSLAVFTLMQRDTAFIHENPNMPYPDLVPLIPVAPTAEAEKVGESMLVCPAKEYWIRITTNEFVDNKGNIVNPKYIAQVLPPTKISVPDGFVSGKSYNVNIKVSSLQTAEVNTSLEQWVVDDSDIDIDTGGDTGYEAGRLKDRYYLYFGNSANEVVTKLPAKFYYREMKDKNRTVWNWDQIYCGENYIHWIAIPNGYKITSLTGMENILGKSYLDQLQDGGEFIIDDREPYRVYYIRYQAPYKEAYNIRIEKK